MQACSGQHSPGSHSLLEAWGGTGYLGIQVIAPRTTGAHLAAALTPEHSNFVRISFLMARSASN